MQRGAAGNHHPPRLELSGLMKRPCRTTSLAAANVGITNRGRIAPGMFTDLVLLDTAALADRATPKEPHLTATGVRVMWVNGVLVYNSAATGAFPGRVIRRARG